MSHATARHRAPRKPLRAVLGGLFSSLPSLTPADRTCLPVGVPAIREAALLLAYEQAPKENVEVGETA